MADLLPVHAIMDGATVRAYVRTSDVYGETGGLAAKVGIKKVKAADLTGLEEILPIKEALRVGLISRIVIRYKNAANKKASAKVLTRTSELAKLFSDTAANTLTGVDYKIGTLTKGKITAVGIARRAHSYH
jgi:hypothetical protein